MAGAPQFGLDRYIGAFNFKVEIDGVAVENTKFISVSGVVSTSETMEFMHGDDRYLISCGGSVVPSKCEERSDVGTVRNWTELAGSGRYCARCVRAVWWLDLGARSCGSGVFQPERASCSMERPICRSPWSGARGFRGLDR